MATIFEKLSQKYEINNIGWGEAYLSSYDGPCYIYYGEIPYHGMQKKDVLPYLKSCARQVQYGVVILSVTEQEMPHNKIFLEEAKKIPGATITKSRSFHKGNYDVWCICIPGSKK